MDRYIVTYRSMEVEADDADEAISRAMDSSGGNWEAELADGGTPLMKIEVLHNRYPDDDCYVLVVIDGVPQPEAAITYVNVDPGRGYTVEDWDESTDWESQPERGHTPAFAVAVAGAYADGRDSSYIQKDEGEAVITHYPGSITLDQETGTITGSARYVSSYGDGLPEVNIDGEPVEKDGES